MADSMNLPSGCDDVDIDLVRAEINAEAEEWRGRDPEIIFLERKIEQEWIDIAPPGAVSGNQQYLDRFEKLASVRDDTPAEPRKYVRKVKEAIHKIIHWYIHYIAGQINGILKLLTRYLRHIEARVDDLEHANRLHSEATHFLGVIPEPSSATAAMVASLVDSKHCSVLSCGEGSIVEAIYSSGGNAYGVEQDIHRVLTGTKRGLDIRSGCVVEHLASIEDNGLDAIVFAGVVETLPLASLIKLIEEADRVLARPGIIVVAVPDLASRGLVEAELRYGCGISPLTWQHLLDQIGFDTQLVASPGPHITKLVMAQRS